MPFKFAHFADIHLGAFRDPVLRELNVHAFEKAIDICVELKTDFIIIAGDLFEIALPDMAVVDRAVRKMKELKDLGILIYVVYGSHDYSATEISIIDILGSAGLLKKVVNADVTDTGKIRLSFFTDEKTGAKLAGMSARKRGAERTYYENLDCAHLEENENNNFKIFLFHSTLNEMKPEFLSMSDGIPLSNFPKNFNYYAGGHVHKRMERDFAGYGKFVFPGHLFGRDYRDLENHAVSRQAFEDFGTKGSQKLDTKYQDSSIPQNASSEEGGFYFVEVDSSSKIVMHFEPMDLCSVLSLHYKAGGKTSYVAAEELKKTIDNLEAFPDKKPSIVLFRISGELSGGKPSDINFGELKNVLLKKGAGAVYFNHNSLSSRELEQLKIKGADRRDIEEKIFEESLGLFEKKAQLKNAVLSKKEGCALSASLLSILKAENTGESKSDYEIKIKRSAFGALGLGESQ